MPTIQHEILISQPIDTVWDAVRDVGELHVRLVPGFVISTSMLEGVTTPTRRVTFANGVVLDETIVTIDDDRQRLVWSITSVDHHNGAIQVFDVDGNSRVIWTADVLPAELAQTFSPLMAAGLATMKAHLESAS